MFNEDEKEKINNYIYKLEKYGIIINENILLDDEQELEMKIKDLFYNINMLDNYTDHEWFLSLNTLELINLYIKAEDIWNYRAMLSQEAKEKIIGNEIIFEIPIHIIKYSKSKTFMRTVLLKIFNAMISNGIDINEKKLGAILVLSALVEINPNAFDAMPHLAQH
jgi:DNA-binding Lrp family transcriptional regulator